MTQEEKTKLAELREKMIPEDVQNAAWIVGKTRQNMAAFIGEKRPFTKKAAEYLEALEWAILERKAWEQRRADRAGIFGVPITNGG